VSQPPDLFGAEGLDGIDLRRAASGDGAGKDGDGETESYSRECESESP
jgi:hypothetical protein